MSSGASDDRKGGHDLAALAYSCDESPEASFLRDLLPKKKSKKGDVAAISGTGAQRPARSAAKRRPKLEYWTLNPDDGQNTGMPVLIRGRWLHESHTKMRNAAWFVRNARMTGQDEHVMLTQLCFEVRRLLARGESVESIVPSLVDLFMRP